MGFLKKIGKAISKGLRKVGHGLSKGLKKVWKSKIGKMLVIAGAIYLGGAMLAMNYGASASSAFTLQGSMSGYSQAFGKLAALGSSTSGTSGAVTAAQPTLANIPTTVDLVGPNAANVFGSTAGTAATGASEATLAGLPTSVDLVAPQAGNVLGSASTSLANAGAAESGGFLSKVAALAKDNPLATYGVIQGVGSAIQAANTPSAEEEQAGQLRAMQNANRFTGTVGPGSVSISTPSSPPPDNAGILSNYNRLVPLYQQRG